MSDKTKKILKICTLILIIVGIILSVLLINRKQFNEMTIEEKVNYRMKNMSIEQKIAQMLVLYYVSDVVDDNLINTLKNTTPGGFILIKENITTYEKIKKFVNDLKANSEIPLIISIDQEGGSVQRLQYLSDVRPTYIPYMYDLGKTNDGKLAYDVGKLMAEELRTIGVNVAYAPVLDIYSNKENTVIGKRSFGETKEIVSKMALSFSKGLEENGVIGTYKHFPGHGDTEIDSHYELPIIEKTYEQLKENELTTFKDAIQNDAKIIMIGHIALPTITNNEEPASLSKTVITDILKNDMGYKGLVITDALNMGALTNTYTDEEIYTKAINAGVDLLLMPNGSKNAIEYIKKNITKQRIDESVLKILTFKYTYLDNNNNLEKEILGSKQHQQIISEINTDIE